jgi:Rv2258c-like winged HTH domain
MPDNSLVMEFLERVIADGAAAVAGLSTALGDRLGLYSAMAGAGPLTSVQLAGRTGLNERYVREWLAGQVAGEYVRYDEKGDTYLLPDEHAAVLADPDSPTYAVGTFQTLGAFYGLEDALAEAFRTGEGVGWQDYGSGLFEGTATLFRPGYAAALVSEWLPVLDGVVEKLERGASVADIGCTFGHSARAPCGHVVILPERIVSQISRAIRIAVALIVSSAAISRPTFSPSRTAPTRRSHR